MIEHYDWAGGREAMLRFGPDDGPVVVVALPLFEEANRTRAFMATICRALATRDIASLLPDLPGQGESLIPTQSASLDDWRAAFAAAVHAAGRPAHIVAIRGGSLVDSEADALSRWHFAPAAGDALVGEMLRAVYQAALPKRIDFRLHAVSDGPPIALFGNPVARRTIIALQAATPSQATPLRTVRLGSDPRNADRKIAGVPLWRRSEPANDLVLAETLADDISDWVRKCAG